MRLILLAVSFGLALATWAIAQPAVAPPQPPPTAEEQLDGLRFGIGQVQEQNGRLQQENAQLSSANRTLRKQKEILCKAAPKEALCQPEGKPAGAPAP
jgi:hypothetical protein